MYTNLCNIIYKTKNNKIISNYDIFGSENVLDRYYYCSIRYS